MSSRGPDWDFYQCKCGNILFEYNVVTGEKFMSETWSRCTATCMTPVTHVPTHTSPFPPMPIGPPKEKVSTGTETDEVLTDSCSCTSNTVNNETKHATNCCGEKVENSTSTNEEPSVGSALTQTSTLDTTGSNGLHFEETLTKTTDLKPSASLPSDAILEAPVDKTVCEKVINRGLESNGKTEDPEEVEKAIHEKENEKECEIEKMGTKEMKINNENDEEAVEKQESGKMEDEIEKVENETKENENEVKLEEEKELENETEKMKDNKTKNEGIEAMETETEKETSENEETKEQESKILEVDSSNDKTAKDDDLTEKESTEIEKEKKEIEENETQEISDAKKEVDDKQDKEESKPSEPSEEDESKEKTPERKTRSNTRNKSSKQTPTKPSPGKTLRKRKAETEETERRTPVTRTQYPRRSPRLNVTKKRKTR